MRDLGLVYAGELICGEFPIGHSAHPTINIDNGLNYRATAF